MTSDADLIDFANSVFAIAEARDIDPCDAIAMLGCIVTTILRGCYAEHEQRIAAQAFANHLLRQFPDNATRH